MGTNRPTPSRLAAAVLMLGAVLVPDAVHGGDLFQHGASANGDNCLEVSSATSALVSAYCHGGDEQLFTMLDRRTLRVGSDSSSQCLKYFDDNSVKAAVCDAGSWNQQWRVKYDGTIAAVGVDKFGLCLNASSSIGGAAKLSDCRSVEPSQLVRSSSLAVDTGDVLSANGLCLDFAGTTTAVPGPCHGSPNQVWSYSFDQELRTVDGNCLEFDQAGLQRVTVGKCSKADKQKWSLGAAAGNVSPLSTPSLCLDLSKYPVELTTCGSPKPTATQTFSVASLISARSRNLKRTMIEAPLVYVGPNCVTVNRANQDAYISPCSRNVDMWWEVLTSKTIKLAGELCLDLSQAETGRVTYTKCTGQVNQQWNWNADSGAVTSVAQSGKCLAFSTTGGTGYESIKLIAQDCTPGSPRDNQVFRQRDFSDVLPPSRASVQQSYCSQRSQHPGNLQFLRDTLLWSAKDVRGFVPTTLTGREDYSYYTSVVLESISAIIGESARSLTESEIVTKVSATASIGAKALLELGELMCSVRERGAELRPKLASLFTVFNADNKRLANVVSYLRLANLQFQFTALPVDSTLLSVASSSIAKSLDTVLQGYMGASDFVGLSSFALSSDFAWFAQTVVSLCTVKPSLAICAATSFSELVSVRSDLRDAVNAATMTSLRTNELVTIDVLTRADTFMQKYRKGLAASGSLNSDAGWDSLVQSTLFGSAKPVFNSSDLLRTTANSDLMMVFVLWPYFTAQELSNSTWSPLFASLDSQFYGARRATIQNIVYSLRVQTLDAYFGGLSSDMATMATQVLPRVCARFPQLKSCALVQLHALVTAHGDLDRRLRSLGTMTDETDSLAAVFAKVYVDGVVLKDDLWTMTAVRLLFNSVELQVYPSTNSSVLLTTATPSTFLTLYAVFAQYSNGMTSLLPYFTFLSDQVAVAHFNAINKLVNDRDVAGMSVYVDPSSNATVSDLGVFGVVVLPRLCNDPNNPDFSVCKLQDFYSGLVQAITFEKSRSARTVSLVDIVEVDVRKQLDVIDQESKQMEIISAIQDSANLVGKTIQEESDKIQVTVKAEAASIRATIATNTEILNQQIGDVGRQIQQDIDASTRILEDTIGVAADAIRQDIADNTQKLYNQMDEKSRAIQQSIDANTKKLATQIGAEAQATRTLISDSTRQLSGQISQEAQATRNKIDESTSKLYNKIGEESKAIRGDIAESTTKLYNKIGEEGQKTRTKIDESTVQLTQVINTNTAKLEGKIAASTSTIVSKFATGFSTLEGYFKADIATTLLAKIRAANKKTQEAIDVLSVNINAYLDAIDEITYETEEQSTQVEETLYNCAEVANYVNWLAYLSLYTLNPVYNDDSLSARFDSKYYAETISKLTTPSRLVDRAKKMLQQMLAFYGNMQKYYSLVDAMGKDFSDMTEKLKDPNVTPSPDQVVQIANTVLQVYKKLDWSLPPEAVWPYAREFDGFMDSMQDVAKDYENGKLLSQVKLARKLFQIRLDLYITAASVASEQFELIGLAARDAVNSQSGNNLADAAKGGKRRLQASTNFKPLYSMAYAGLSKLFMQYRIQQAALEFCNYYEYKLGGVAPSMCGKTKFYTPADIQKMRSYKPPAVKSFSYFALMPTKPTPASTSDTTPPRPYLDLDKLVAGETVSFALPTTDLAWLKQYKWIYRADNEASFDGIYIESMQLVLPFTATGNGSSVNPVEFNMAVNVKIGQTQRINSLSDKTYVLPSAEVRFSSAFNARLCLNKITNPYHDVASCIKGDGSSSLCAYDDGQVPSTELLPSLFSRWEISMPRDGSVNVGDTYKLALPNLNTTDAVDLNVIVIVKVVRVLNAKTTALEVSSTADGLESVGINAAADATCCATDEYFGGSSCVKCPDGSTGALNGYTCQRN